MKRIGQGNPPLPTSSGATAGAGGTTSVVTQFPNGAYTDNANHYTTSQIIGAVGATVYATVSTTGILWSDTGNSDSASINYDGGANVLAVTAAFTTFSGRATFANNVAVTGAMSATTFHGDGAAVTGLAAANLTGTVITARLGSAGSSVADSTLSSNVPLLNAVN